MRMVMKLFLDLSLLKMVQVSAFDRIIALYVNQGITQKLNNARVVVSVVHEFEQFGTNERTPPIRHQ